jgi:hypothetical protein
VLSGGGTIIGDLVLDGGTLGPGDPQTLNVSGNYAQTMAGILALDFADSSSYDQNVIGGNATLSGKCLPAATGRVVRDKIVERLTQCATKRHRRRSARERSCRPAVR